MRKWLSILLTVISFQLYAQSKRLVIQIDTVDYVLASYKHFKVKVDKQGFMNEGDVFDSTQQLSTDYFPNFINTIYLSHDSSAIQLPIDTNGSYISIKNGYHFQGDTIRINRLPVCRTPPVDSTYSATYYYRVMDDSLEIPPYKTEYKQSGNPLILPTEHLEIHINTIRYQFILVPLKIEGEIVRGHGYIPKNNRKKNGDFRRKKVTYLYFASNSCTYVWKGNLVLMF